MNSIWLATAALASFYVGYRFYSSFLAKWIYQLDPDYQTPAHELEDDTPALVVGLIVDQMRPDYIYRYWDKFEDGGIKRLVNEGHFFKNAYFRHL